MTSIISTLRQIARKRAQYLRTVNELSHMDINTALDLNIHKGDIRRIAYQSVYGV